MIYLATLKPPTTGAYYQHIFYDTENSYLYRYITMRGNKKYTYTYSKFGLYDHNTNTCDIILGSVFCLGEQEIIPKNKRYIKLCEELNDTITNIIFDKL